MRLPFFSTFPQQQRLLLDQSYEAVRSSEVFLPALSVPLFKSPVFFKQFPPLLYNTKTGINKQINVCLDPNLAVDRIRISKIQIKTPKNSGLQDT